MTIFIAIDEGFNETDHPRAPDGKFGSGSSPLNMSSLKKVGGQLGSNPGGVYEGDGGKRYYIKKGRSKDHVRNELLAGDLYKLAGAKTVQYKPVEGGEQIATEWEKPEKKTAREFTPAELKKAQEDFAVHAWTANWDAAGLDYDNQMIIDGKPTSVDLGGALNYRAQGAPKGNAFGDTVGEWNTLRDPKINPQNAKMFSGMSEQQLKESAQKVTRIPDEKIRAAVGDDKALAEKLIARKKDIAKKAGVIAADEKGFKEEDHPRDKDGKFGKGGGGSAAGGEKEGHRVAKPVRKVLKSGGFVKVQGGKDEIKFAHPQTGMRVIIHKVPGVLRSDVFTVKGPNGKEQASKGAVQLSKVLAQMLASAAAGSPTGASTPAPAAKTAQAPSPIGAPSAPATPSGPPTKPAEPPKELKEAGGAEGYLTAKGYKPLHEDKFTSTWKADSGAMVEYNHSSDDWVAQTPGKITKEGKGFESLQKLLSGEKPAPGTAPWKNSAKTIYDPTSVAGKTAKASKSEEAVAKQREHYKEVLTPAAPVATAEQSSALSSYTGSGYSSINDGLRHSSTYAKNSKTVQHLDAYLKKASFPEDVTLFRQVSGDYAKILKSIVVEGGKFIDRGFSSTSSVEGVWHGNLKMVITAKKGSKGAAVRKYSNHDSEYEVLLPRNSGYLVTQYDEDAGVIHVTLDQSHFKD